MNEQEFNEMLANRLFEYSEYYKKILDPKEADEERQNYMNELEQLSDEFLHILKSLNWFADIVRFDFDPNYFKVHGKFMNAHPGRPILANEYIYTEEEKCDLMENTNYQNYCCYSGAYCA
jgi:hypothetical protein